MRPSSRSAWIPVELSPRPSRRGGTDHLRSLARAEVPAVVFRAAYPQPACAELVERLIANDLAYDPAAPTPDRFLREGIPEGYVRVSGDRSSPSRPAPRAGRKRRIDIGTSLGYRGDDPEGFFRHADETRRRFRTLFRGTANPIDVIYDRLAQLGPGRTVRTAREPTGERYGPAIFRVHYGDYAYPPHFDSVRLREKRNAYSVYRFEHQFAGVLVLQNAVRGRETAQCIIHRRLWDRDVDEHLSAGTFHRYARATRIESCRVELEPGDLYFFNTRAIHEVPGVDGDLPRVVLATFIGYSESDPEVAVWS